MFGCLSSRDRTVLGEPAFAHRYIGSLNPDQPSLYCVIPQEESLVKLDEGELEVERQSQSEAGRCTISSCCIIVVAALYNGDAALGKPCKRHDATISTSIYIYGSPTTLLTATHKTSRSKQACTCGVEVLP